MLCLWAALARAGDAAVAPATEALVIDGVLDEPAWAAAPPVTDFLRFQPVAGGPPAGRTEVRFLQDDRYLYVGVRVTDAGYPIRARVSPREDINSDDQVGVYLDTFRDGRTGYIFYFNPLGIQQDIRHNNGTWNVSWDTAFRSRGRLTEDGYAIEIAFPWRALKYPSERTPQEWGVILTRKIPSEGEKYAWPALERNHPRLFTQAAVLSGVAPAPRGSGLELIPGLTALQAWPDDAGGFDVRTPQVRPSLDARVGITPDIGVTATLLPDFSQVESDVSDVRLNPRFAFQFQDRRPFFLDGIEFTQDRSGTLYTRSIQEPLYGAKVSGREGPWSVGAVHAMDLDPLPSFHERGTPGFDAGDVADRRALATVLRARLDAFDDGYVGVTFADKRVVGTSAAPGDRGTFDAAALDAEIPLSKRWIVGGSTFQSLTAPSPVGPTTWGGDARLTVGRASGIGWGTWFTGAVRSEGMRNETGFLTQSGLGTGTASVDYTFEPDGRVDTYTPSLATTQLYEAEGDYVRDVTTSHAIVVDGVHRMDTTLGAAAWREGTVDARGLSFELAYDGQIGRVVEVGPTFAAARVLDYGNLVPADALRATGDLVLRPTAGIRLDTTASWQRLAPVGAETLSSVLWRNRLNWQFTRTIGLRVVEEWTSGTGRPPSLQSSVLLTWLDVPGTAAYLGWSEVTDLDARAPVERSIFAKVSVLLRP